jgi:hypothetical protein
MDSVHDFTAGLFRVDKSSFDIVTGLRAAAFAIVPAVIGLAIRQPELLLMSLGAIFLTNTEGRPPSVLPVEVLLVACFAEAAAFGLGTLASTAPGLLLPLLLGVGVFALLTIRRNPRWGQVGTFSAVVFAIGIGLPHGSVQAAGEESVLMLAGGLLATFGAWLQRLPTHHTPSQERSAVTQVQQPRPILAAFVIAVAAALGFTIGLALELPRDFWVVVTIITAVRQNLGMTISFTLTTAIGTVAGALIAAAITLETSSPYLLLPLLFTFASLMFASRGVNIVLLQMFLVPFVIILLNIIYPGQWYLALYRILDVVIGGAIAIGAVYLFVATDRLKRRGDTLVQTR